MVLTHADRPIVLNLKKALEDADGYWTPPTDQDGRMDVAHIVSELTGRPWQRDVDDIIAHVQVTAEDGTLTSTLLLVRWAGYDDSHNSWLYAEDVRSSDIERYFSGESVQLGVWHYTPARL